MYTFQKEEFVMSNSEQDKAIDKLLGVLKRAPLGKVEKELDKILNTLTFEVIGNLFDFKGPEVDFFKDQIVNKGLLDFHITIASGTTDDQKREAVKEIIELWDAKPRIITDL